MTPKSWYYRALDIEMEPGHQPGMASTFAQVGLLAGQRGELHEVLEQAIRSVALFEPIPDPLPQAVRDYVESSAHPGRAG
jgi:hypothetical protein